MNTMRTESDVELLEAYAKRNDQGAFAEIVSRYGSLVYHVSFRKLLNRQDAEDASQAVFMALIKNSDKLKHGSSLACWLHAVARQTALFAARTRVNRLKRENAASEMIGNESHPQANTQDHETILKFLDDELHALSAVQQEAVILRYLQGLSEKDAAAIAGCAAHTLTCRLNEGISNLRKRLVRRGCALGIPALIGVIGTESQAAVPQTLIPSLLAVPKLAAAGATAGTASANIMFLMEGAMKIMCWSKIKTVGVCLLAVMLIGIIGFTTLKHLAKGKVPDTNVKSVAVPSHGTKGDIKKVQDQSQKIISIITSSSKKKSASTIKTGKGINYQDEAEKALKGKDLDLFNNLVWEWFGKDKDAVIRWAEDKLPLMDEESYLSGLMVICAVWAQQDPTAAKEWCMRLPDTPSKISAFYGTAAGWAQIDPAAAAEWAMQLPEGLNRVDLVELIRLAAISGVAGVWMKNDPAAAKDWAMKLPEEDKNQVLSMDVAAVAENIANNDFETAADDIMKMPDGGRKIMKVIDLASKWVENDPLAAMEWAIQLPEGGERNNAIYTALGKWAKKDINALASWAEQLPEGKNRDEMLPYVAGMWDEKNLEALVRWSEQLPAGNAKDNVMSNVAGNWAGSDPAKTIEWVEKLPDEKVRNKALAEIAKSWGGSNPAKAIEWAEKLPDEQVKNQSLVNIVNSWARNDHDAAAKWVLQLPEGKVRDESLENVGRMWASSSISGIGSYFSSDIPAAEWAMKLPDEKSRFCALTGVLRFWMNLNPPKAQKWLEQSSLQQEEKDKLLEKIKIEKNSP